MSSSTGVYPAVIFISIFVMGDWRFLIVAGFIFVFAKARYFRSIGFIYLATVDLMASAMLRFMGEGE
jgi:hypothetical protein